MASCRTSLGVQRGGASFPFSVAKGTGTFLKLVCDVSRPRNLELRLWGRDRGLFGDVFVRLATFTRSSC